MKMRVDVSGIRDMRTVPSENNITNVNIKMNYATLYMTEVRIND